MPRAKGRGDAKKEMPMFDSYLIRKDSLENVTENGKVVGFRFAVRIADYRGCMLSLHNGYYIEVDGEVYPREVQKFEINGKAPRDFQEIKKAVWDTGTLMTKAMFMLRRKAGLRPAYTMWGSSSLSWWPTDICRCCPNG